MFTPQRIIPALALIVGLFWAVSAQAQYKGYSFGGYAGLGGYGGYGYDGLGGYGGYGYDGFDYRYDGYDTGNRYQYGTYRFPRYEGYRYRPNRGLRGRVFRRGYGYPNYRRYRSFRGWRW